MDALEVVTAAEAAACVSSQAGGEPRCLMDFWAQRCLEEAAEAAAEGRAAPAHTTDAAMVSSFGCYCRLLPLKSPLPLRKLIPYFVTCSGILPIACIGVSCSPRCHRQIFDVQNNEGSWTCTCHEVGCSRLRMMCAHALCACTCRQTL